MEKVDDIKLERFLLTLPWQVLRFFGRIVRRFFVVVGVLAALAVVGYVEFESIVETIDSRYSRPDRRLPGHRQESDLAAA